MDSSVILVVGNGPSTSPVDGQTYKSSIAAVLSKCGYIVIETTDIVVSGEFGTLVDARSWISKNSLRRLNGQNVKILCAMDANGRCDRAWVNILLLIFKKHSPSVAAILQETFFRVSEPLQDLVSDLHTSVVVETVDGDCVPRLRRILNDLEPFQIRTEGISNRDIEAWSSEKVILFGRTGSGKSTIAQMLTLGRLDPSGSSFKASSSARGITQRIDRGEGRGWHVTDTPGFGEAKEGTVSTKDATKILKKFVIGTCGIYSHYLYVVKKDRMNVYDERLWMFFNKVFCGAEGNFSVVVTGCTTGLSQEDNDHLQKTFPGCKNFICVDFSPIDLEDSELEEENEEVRGESLLKLENGLARLGFAEIECKEGEFLSGRVKLDRKHSGAYLVDSASSGTDLVAEAIHYLVSKPRAAFGGFLHKSKVDENFILLPQ